MKRKGGFFEKPKSSNIRMASTESSTRTRQTAEKETDPENHCCG